MTISPKTKVYLLFGFLALIVAVVVYAIINKNIKNRNAKAIGDAIDQGIGTLGTDIDSLLFNTKIESGYNTPKADLQKLKDAQGTFSDSPDNFAQVFSGKSKARIKKIVKDFQAAYGIKLNDYINEVFDDTFGYDSKRYDQLLNLIRSAK